MTYNVSSGTLSLYTTLLYASIVADVNQTLKVKTSFSLIAGHIYTSLFMCNIATQCAVNFTDCHCQLTRK